MSMEIPTSGLVAHFEANRVMVWIDGEPMASEPMGAAEFLEFLQDGLGTEPFLDFCQRQMEDFGKRFLPGLATLARKDRPEPKVRS